MPLHRYKCNKCGEEFTRLVRTQDKGEIKCDKCGSMEVEKLLPRISVGRGKTGEGSS
ncbi:zinc ribbon domain-containing protein, partial [Candidatus Aerophobetes bacterium]